MMVDISVGGILVRFAGHLDSKIFKFVETDDYLIGIKTNIDSIISLLIVVVIPFYLSLLRASFYKYIPGVLKRLGLGMIFILLSILCSYIDNEYLWTCACQHNRMLPYK